MYILYFLLVSRFFSFFIFIVLLYMIKKLYSLKYIIILYIYLNRGSHQKKETKNIHENKYKFVYA